VAPVPGRPAVYDSRWTIGALNPAQQWEVAVGAILTQNTSWLNVEKAFSHLRRSKTSSPQCIGRCPVDRLAQLIRPSGFFHQKAARLQSLARYLLTRWNGSLSALLHQDVSVARAELLRLSGVGPETADSILLYAGGHPVFVVDTYTKRLAHRLSFFRYNDYAMIQSFFHQRVEPSAPTRKEFHALVVAHAKAHCRARPLCGGCPLALRCVSRVEN
jgi:endonuclease-3 related protein